jgi:transcriptional regulator with XRE-family HTH domain
MRLSDFHTEEEILKELGNRLKAERIRQKMTQETFAINCGVAKSTIERFEKGESVQLSNLLKMLRTLHQLSGIEMLLPSAELSPMQIIYSKTEKEPKRFYTVREKSPKYGSKKTETKPLSEKQSFVWAEDK